MDIYCINIFCDDRDFELKPWTQNGGFVYEEDKAILREMWRMYNAAEDRKENKGVQRKGKKKVDPNNEERIRQALISKGYGIRKGPHKKK